MPYPTRLDLEQPKAEGLDMNRGRVVNPGGYQGDKIEALNTDQAS